MLLSTTTFLSNASTVTLNAQYTQATVEKILRPCLSSSLWYFVCLMMFLLEKLRDSELLPLKRNCKFSEPSVWFSGCYYQPTPGIIVVSSRETHKGKVREALPAFWCRTSSLMIFCLAKSENRIRVLPVTHFFSSDVSA
jgi:hypothetical protein